MSKISELARAALQGHLGANETFLAAGRAQLDGGTMRLANRVGFSVGLGLAAGVATTSAAGSPDDVAAELSNGVVIAVTSQRVALLSVTAVSAKPKAVVLFIDRNAIVRVETGEKRVMLVKMPTIALVLRDGERPEIGFEIPKGCRADGESVVAALNG